MKYAHDSSKSASSQYSLATSTWFQYLTAAESFELSIVGTLFVVEADRRRVVRARHREEREVAHAVLVLDALDAFVDAP